MGIAVAVVELKKGEGSATPLGMGLQLLLLYPCSLERHCKAGACRTAACLQDCNAVSARLHACTRLLYCELG
jgi:hypothetical protein